MGTPPAVAVTGLGIVSPLGVGHEQFWQNLCAGRSGIRPLADADGEVPKVTARLVEFAPRDFIVSSHLRRADSLSRAIVAAARMALTDAGLDDHPVTPERVGVVVGSAIGDVGESVQYLERLFTKGPTLVSPMIFPNLVLNAPASYAAMEIGCTGANFTVTQGEVSGEQAVALGYDLIRSGRADVVLAGGGDALADFVISAYRSFRALSGQRGGAEWCSPYDAGRNGIVLGEGAAMLLLESTAHARQRGALPYAEMEDYLSFGIPASPYDWPRRAVTAPVRLQELLRRAERRGVDLVCGSANSSRNLDACELDILGRVFGEAAPTISLTSIKGAIGEFGAAGALTAVAACLALRDGMVPPLCHLREPPVGSGFGFAPRTALPRPIGSTLLLSIARGGATMALLLRRPGP